MICLQGERITLACLEREHCKELWTTDEYDFDVRAELLNIGHSVEKADEWFEQIQKSQGNTHVRLGIFLAEGTVIGDVALQDIDWQNRACTMGMGISKRCNRSQGYGGEAVRLMLHYAFDHLGLERVSASTNERNIGAQRSLEKAGFMLEGRARKAVRLGRQRCDMLHYAILAQEYAGPGEAE